MVFLSIAAVVALTLSMVAIYLIRKEVSDRMSDAVKLAEALKPVLENLRRREERIARCHHGPWTSGRCTKCDAFLVDVEKNKYGTSSAQPPPDD